MEYVVFSKRKEGAADEKGLNVRSKYSQIIVCGPMTVGWYALLQKVAVKCLSCTVGTESYSSLADMAFSLTILQDKYIS